MGSSHETVLLACDGACNPAQRLEESAPIPGHRYNKKDGFPHPVRTDFFPRITCWEYYVMRGPVTVFFSCCVYGAA